MLGGFASAPLADRVSPSALSRDLSKRDLAEAVVPGVTALSASCPWVL